MPYEMVIRNEEDDQENLILETSDQSPQRGQRRANNGSMVDETKYVCFGYLRIITLTLLVLVIGITYGWGSGNESLVEETGEISPKHIKPTVVEDLFDYARVMDAQFLERLDKTDEAIDKQIRAIEKEWDVEHFPILLTTIHMPKSSYDLQVNKFRLKLMDISQEASLGAVSFVVGVSGSSVTAGHDNYYNQSYAAVLATTLASTFEALGVALDVPNRAMGNNPCMPYDICVPTFFGRNVDVLTWEQSMFCGHEPAPVEAFTRSAFHMTDAVRPPTIIFLSSGTPYWAPESCDPALAAAKNMTPPSSARGPLTDQERSALRLRDTHYSDVVSQQTYLQDFTFLRGRKGAPVGAPTVASLYADLPVFAQHVIGISDFKCQGPFSPDFSQRGASGGNPWHPGIKGHRFRAHSLAYPLLKTLKAAVIEMRRVIRGGGEKGLHAWRTSAIKTQDTKALIRAPPVSAACDAKYCLSGEPKCYTDFLPRHHAAPLLSAAAYSGRKVYDHSREFESSDTQHPHGSDGTLTDTSLSGRVVGNSTWTQELSFFDRHAVEKGEAANLGYQDRKLVLISPENSTGGPMASVSLHVDIGSENAGHFGGIVLLCELQKGFLQYPPDFGDLDAEAIVAVTDVDTPYSGFEALFATNVTSFAKLDGNGVKFLPISKAEDSCYLLEGLPSGHRTLTIWPRGNKRITLAYLVSW